MASNMVLAGVIGTSVAIMISGLLIPIGLNVAGTFGTVNGNLTTASNIAYILPLVGVAVFIVGMFGVGLSR